MFHYQRCVWHLVLMVDGMGEQTSTLLSNALSIFILSTEVEEGRPPIKVKFEIPYFTTSGIQVSPPMSLTVRHPYVLGNLPLLIASMA